HHRDRTSLTQQDKSTAQCQVNRHRMTREKSPRTGVVPTRGQIEAVEATHRCPLLPVGQLNKGEGAFSMVRVGHAGSLILAAFLGSSALVLPATFAPTEAHPCATFNHGRCTDNCMNGPKSYDINWVVGCTRTCDRNADFCARNPQLSGASVKSSSTAP